MSFGGSTGPKLFALKVSDPKLTASTLALRFFFQGFSDQMMKIRTNQWLWWMPSKVRDYSTKSKHMYEKIMISREVEGSLKAVQAESYIQVSRRLHHRRSCKGGQRCAQQGWEVGMMLRPRWEHKLPERSKYFQQACSSQNHCFFLSNLFFLLLDREIEMSHLWGKLPQIFFLKLWHSHGSWTFSNFYDFIVNKVYSQSPLSVVRGSPRMVSLQCEERAWSMRAELSLGTVIWLNRFLSDLQ